MTEHQTTSHEPPIDDTDVLVSRLIDGVHTNDDREHFETIAAGNPDLWRVLASQQLDHRALEDRVADITAIADDIEIAPAARRFFPQRTTWTLALSGWAAVLMLSLTWASMSMLGTPGNTIRAADSGNQRSLSPEEHYQLYLQAPWIDGEQSEVITFSEELPDGSTRIQFMRRIVETAIIPPGEPIPQEDGYLTAEPADLKRE